MKNRVAVAVAACLAIVAVSGCPAAPPTTKTPVTPASKAPSPSASAAAKAVEGKSILGTVKLPTGYNVISTGGGNFVSTNGGTVVPTGGGNVISTGGGNLRTVLKVDESAAAGAVVTLVDEDGDKVAGVASVKADADGNYAFSNVPDGTFLVEVETEKDGKAAKFDTIVEAGDTNADVNAASTIVAAGVLENLDGDLDQLEIDSFESAVSKTGKSLDNAQLPDFTSDSAILAKFDELSEEIAELKSLVEELSAKIDALTAKIEALTAQLSKQSSGDCGMPPGLDANGDGSVSFEEFRIPPHETLSRETVFRHLDVNKDQKLVASEFCSKPPAPPPPPSGTTGSPAPSGQTQPPPPPPGECGPITPHTFVITGYVPKVGDRLIALRRDGSQTPFNGTIENGKANFALPENCPHKFKVTNQSGQLMATGTEEVQVQAGQAEVTLKF